MTTATVTTDINIGPFKIPSNAQNMIMNFYAQKRNLSVDFVIPEPILSNQLRTLIWLHAQLHFQNVILSSIHQLPRDPKHRALVSETLVEANLHFVIENIYGKGLTFIEECFREVDFFTNAGSICAEKTGWLNIFELSNLS